MRVCFGEFRRRACLLWRVYAWRVHARSVDILQLDRYGSCFEVKLFRSTQVLMTADVCWSLWGLVYSCERRFCRVSTYGGVPHHVTVFVQRILDDRRVYVLPWGSKLTE